MNKKIEEEFVKNYIVSNKRERLLFELKGKKRKDGIGRFCHCTDVLLKETIIKESGKYIRDELQNVIDTVKEETCYIISYFEDIDGKEMDKREVLNTIIGRGMPSIAIFKDVAIIETEQEQGAAVKFLLQKV